MMTETRSRSFVAKTLERPIFVLGCAWRCGSTLLQRYLNSTGQVFVWGEHGGLVSSMAEAFSRVRRLESLIERQRHAFSVHRHKAWIANLNPDSAPGFAAATAAALSAYYDGPTLALGLARWGFKEVRYSAREADLLLSAFPSARVVFLARQIGDVLASNAANDWYASIGGEKGVLEQWLRSTTSFLSCQDRRVRVFRYEDLIGDPAKFTHQLASHVGIEGAAFDQTLLSARVRGAREPPRQPPPSVSSEALRVMSQLYPEAS